MTGIPSIAVKAGQVAWTVGKPEALRLCVWADGTARTLLRGLRCNPEKARVLWSADGASLFYAAAGASWFHDLWQVDLAAGNPTALTDYYRVQSYPAGVHPAGETLLAFSDLRGALNLRRYDLNTGDFRKITDYATPVEHAVYHPAGERIAYSANATYNPHNRDIYVMDADGFDKRRALGTLAGAADIVCDWSVDGGWLAIMSNFDGGWQAGVLNLKTGTPMFFTPPERNQRPVAFSPDGALLLVRGSDEMVLFSVIDGMPGGVLDVSVTAAAWLDATTVVFGTAAGELKRWDISSGGVGVLFE